MNTTGRTPKMVFPMPKGMKANEGGSMKGSSKGKGGIGSLGMVGGGKAPDVGGPSHKGRDIVPQKVASMPKLGKGKGK